MAERREEAEATLVRAGALADGIGYRRGQWVVLQLRAEVARRAGHVAAAAEHEARCRALVEQLAGTLPEAELARQLAAAAGFDR